MKKGKVLAAALIMLLILSELILAGCEYSDPFEDPPIPAEFSESDFYGTWSHSSDGPYLWITENMFNWDNRFQMDIKSWTKVSCDVSIVGGVSNPEWKNSIDRSYKITGIVNYNSLYNNGSSAGYKTTGQSQTLYLHLGCFGPTRDNKCIDWSASSTNIYEWNQYFFRGIIK